MNDRKDNPVSVDTYDRGIIPAETAARKEREKEDYKHLPEQEGSLDTTGGFTMDKEGLMNNYAVEPEMYVNEPGDLREEAAAEAAERSREREEVNETDETGKLTMDGDNRGKGPGII
ncbi:hypothetical protein [Altericista sp. CCNU0014]|uniref:hypothetical protein n=1 Tax=Altericista sp. CCNU0014 TaxID=3082949 RepID=UPI00384F77E8